MDPMIIGGAPIYPDTEPLFGLRLGAKIAGAVAGMNFSGTLAAVNAIGIAVDNVTFLIPVEGTNVPRIVAPGKPSRKIFTWDSVGGLEQAFEEEVKPAISLVTT